MLAQPLAGIEGKDGNRTGGFLDDLPADNGPRLIGRDAAEDKGFGFQTVCLCCCFVGHDVLLKVIQYLKMNGFSAMSLGLYGVTVLRPPG
jgi:hypothetical protein